MHRARDVSGYAVQEGVRCGEMRRRLDQFDRAATALAPRAGWPQGFALAPVILVVNAGDAMPQDVASEIGRGPQVTIFLPRSSEAPAAGAVAPERPEPAPGRGETILVVEDNPDVRAVAIAMLEQLQYRAVAVESAAAALSLLKSGRSVDLVFTDVMLPGDLDGVALAQAIRNRYPQVPVVLTSGYAKALGARHGLPILRKPYQLAALAQTIRDNLATRHLGNVPEDGSRERS